MENVVELERRKNHSLQIALGIIFNTETRKIILVKRKKETSVSNRRWCFPGGKIKYNEDLGKNIKEIIKGRTGLDVENLGPVFAETRSNGDNKLLSVYYLCEYVSGEPTLSEELEEIKWLNPSEVEGHMDEELHPNLKEYLLSIGQ